MKSWSYITRKMLCTVWNDQSRGKNKYVCNVRFSTILRLIPWPSRFWHHAVWLVQACPLTTLYDIDPGHNLNEYCAKQNCTDIGLIWTKNPSFRIPLHDERFIIKKSLWNRKCYVQKFMAKFMHTTHKCQLNLRGAKQIKIADFTSWKKEETLSTSERWASNTLQNQT